MERLIRLSIRSHWLLLLIPLLVQYFIGAAIISDHPLLPMPDVIPYLKLLPFTPDRIFEAHVIMGNLFVVAAAFLTMEKVAVIFMPIRRAPIPNAFVSSHVQSHFLGMSFMIMFQWVTMNASEEATRYLKDLFDITVPKRFWSQAHAVNALALVGLSLILVVEKIYLISLRTPKAKTN